MTIGRTELLRSAREHARALETGEYSAEDLSRACLAAARAAENLGVFLKLEEERILQQARAADERRKSGKVLGPLDGIPVALKDNIVEENETVTCASRILEGFVAPYDSSVVQKLRAAGAVLFGRTNMDEFAMGSSTENSAYQLTRNPWNTDCVPGGSSGGSAVAVASGMVPLSLGSDTGGSIRQPAAFTGTIGVKPTYGRVSRYGLVAYASSLDQIGPFARTVEDAALLTSVISGRDPRDSTTRPDADQHPVVWEMQDLHAKEWKGLRVGFALPEGDETGIDAEIAAAAQKAADYLQEQGATIVPLRSRLQKYLIPIYYILATAEASSNLSRYDGVRYGRRADQTENLLELYVRSRTEGFGPEVKRRILLGAFVLSSGYYDAYYKRAQQARRIIQEEFAAFFQKADVLLQPTSPTTAFRFGEKTDDPLKMYQSDILTIQANLGGVPAMSVPAGRDQNGLPIGLQLMAPPFQENVMFRVARELEKAPGYALDFAQVSGVGSPAAGAKTVQRTSKPAAEKPAKKAAKKAAKKTAKQAAAKPASKKTSKKAAAKPATKKAAKQAAKKPAKKTGQSAAKKKARR